MKRLTTVEVYAKPVYLANLRPLDAGPKVPQAQLLENLAQAYGRHFAGKEINAKKHFQDLSAEQTQQKWKELLERFGCGPESIGYRSSVDLQILRPERVASPLEDKMRVYSEHVQKYFRAQQIETELEPADIFHVSCTGYVSPSPLQRVLSELGRNSRVTHLYHMGCYAAFPATRLAALRTVSQSGQTQIVHTELCSLHFQPSELAQDWVVQSLFADGFISYEVGDQKPNLGLQILASAEQLLPESLELMEWNLGARAFQMTLAREVPQRIATHVEGFVQSLLAALPPSSSPVLYAIHPGGPKIIQQVQKTLGLTDLQVAASRDVLFHYGNMSSATVPHIWRRILHQAEVPAGTRVVSLAFGPGLTIAGQVSEVVRQ